MKEIKIDHSLTLEQVSIEKLEKFYLLTQEIKKQGMEYMPEMITSCECMDSTKICLDNYSFKFMHTNAPDFFMVSSGEIIGVIGFHPWKNETEIAELAFWVSPKHQRKGIAFKCLNFLINYSFNNFPIKKIEVLIKPQNTRALRLVEKCGFIQGNDRVEKSNIGSTKYKSYFKNN